MNNFKYTLLTITCLIQQLLFSQINTQNIEIVRDNYGVPHIFTKTDAELAYGLAWAHAEDDFKTTQQAYLAGNSLLSTVIGKNGLGADFIAQLIGSEKLIDENYEKNVSPEYKKVLEGYSAGINSFAKYHPEEVLSKKLFPITPKKMMLYAQLQLFVSSENLVGVCLSAIGVG